MGSYRYEAVDARGKPRRGLIDADTPRQVREELQGQGLFPTLIDSAGRLIGIISIGDVVKRRVNELDSERQALREYIATA